MRNNATSNDVDGLTHRQLADAVMLSALRRAAAGSLKQWEAESCAALMRAFEAWRNGSQRAEAIEHAREIERLARELIQRDDARAEALARLEQRTDAGHKLAANGRRRKPATAKR
jgi:hypothetical protein